MTNNKPIMLLKNGLLGSWIAKKSEMWQMDFLDASRFASFARERGLESYFEQDIIKLWQAGLLKADIIISNRKFRVNGLNNLGKDKYGRYIYSDERILKKRKKGFCNIAGNLKPLREAIELRFHPFRYYVLYHVNRILKINIKPMQMLYSVDQYPNLVDIVISRFQQWSSENGALERICYWNDIASLAIATEPCLYTKLFKTLKYPAFESEEIQRRRIEKHQDEIIKIFREIGIEKIEKIRQELSIDAETIDSNNNLHLIIRMMKASAILQLKGHLGGSIYILIMTEMLRHAAEKALSIHLPEEDEIGFGRIAPEMKEKIYGSKRILDDNKKVRQEFLRQFDLDYGVRIRCYVEGATEYGVLESIFGGYTSIELYNLRGQILQKGSKGVAFRDNLRLDIKTHTFSIVFLDGDKSENVRAVKKAAKDDEICGMFYIFSPDFEFANFTLPELENILWEIAKENNVGEEKRQCLHNAIENANSGKSLLVAARAAIPELSQIDKGYEWGKKLTKYASTQQEMLDHRTGRQIERPIVQAIKTILRSIKANYQTTRKNKRVDPDSGKLVERKDK